MSKLQQGRELYTNGGILLYSTGIPFFHEAREKEEGVRNNECAYEGWGCPCGDGTQCVPPFPAKALGWEGGRALLQYMRAGEVLAQCQAGVALLDLSTYGLVLPRVGSVVD